MPPKVKHRGINAYENAYAASAALIEQGDLEASLAEVRRLMKVVTKSPDADMEFIPCREIDGLLSRIGHAWREAKPASTKSPNESITDTDESLDALILTSFVWDVGGHTREIEDWVEKLRDLGKRTAVMTSLPADKSSGKIRDGLAEQTEYYDHDQKGYVAALAWVAETISRLQPKVIIVSPGTLDVALFAALAALDFEGDLILNLNLDHNMSPGLFIERVDHILVKRPYLYCLLKHDYKRENLIYIPFARSPSIPEELVASRPERDLAAPLTTFSCTSTRYKIENDYAYRFVDVISEMLSRLDVRHIHLGDISESAKQEIVDRMAKAGVDQDRFQHIPFAPRLGDVFVEERVDVLIQTFPVGGGLVAIEAMEAGLVVVNHRCYNTKVFNPSDFCYPGAPVWSDTSELVEVLKGLGEAELERHHQLSRDYYRDCSMPGAIETMLATRDYTGSPVDEEWTRELYDYPLEIGRILGNRETTRHKVSPFAKLLRSIRRSIRHRFS